MLNPQSPIPLYRQLADLLTAQIRRGDHAPGSRIPSEHQLASQHGIGRPTVRQAVDRLVRKGIVTRRRGSGTFVCDAPREVNLFSLDGTSASFQQQGVSVETHIIKAIELCAVGNADDNPFRHQSAYFLSRLTYADKRPALIEDIYLHAKLFAGIDKLDLKDRSLSTIAEEKFYVRPVSGKQCFGISYLKGDRAARLEVAEHTPVLMVKRFLHFPQTANGVYSKLWCRTDQFVFTQHIGGDNYA